MIIKLEKIPKNKRYENAINTKSNEILLCLQKIEDENKNLTEIKKKNNEFQNKMPEIIKQIETKEKEINEEIIKKEKQIEIKNGKKEQYDRSNHIAVNDNKFCHDNFYSLLTLFPYFKNIAK